MPHPKKFRALLYKHGHPLPRHNQLREKKHETKQNRDHDSSPISSQPLLVSFPNPLFFSKYSSLEYYSAFASRPFFSNHELMIMVSLRFCIRSIDLRSETSFYTNPTREKRFGKRATAMRTGVWSWCSPPRRRRRQESSSSPPPSPPPPLSLCPAPAISKPPPLANFAEPVEDEDALSDMDFSALDDVAFQESQQQDVPPNMVMDAVSKKWTGNETEFERFHRIVATLGNDDNPLPDQSVFHVGQRTAQQWHENGQEHNKWFSQGITDQPLDIRCLVAQFSNGVERRKHSS